LQFGHPRVMIARVSNELLAGDPFPPHAVVIEVRVAELRQLFNAIDPSPFRERDLDPNAEEFIVAWARETPPDAPLALRVELDRLPGGPDEATMLRDAIHGFFTSRARSTRGRLRLLFRIGRKSLLIGLVVLAVFFGIGVLLTRWLSPNPVAGFAHESLSIGGWVAMWRPLELFLYDWWPIRAEARLYDRLAVMPIRVTYLGGGPPEAWRRDWPAAAHGDGNRRPTSSS
jgi:hypothetical protein